MSRTNTGTVRILRNEAGEKQWHAKWTRADKKRSEWIPIPAAGEPTIALEDRAGPRPTPQSLRRASGPRG